MQVLHLILKYLCRALSMWYLQFSYFKQVKLHSELVSLSNSEVEIVVSYNWFLIAWCCLQGIFEIIYMRLEQLLNLHLSITNLKEIINFNTVTVSVSVSQNNWLWLIEHDKNFDQWYDISSLKKEGFIAYYHFFELCRFQSCLKMQSSSIQWHKKLVSSTQTFRNHASIPFPPVIISFNFIWF